MLAVMGSSINDMGRHVDGNGKSGRTRGRHREGGYPADRRLAGEVCMVRAAEGLRS